MRLFPRLLPLGACLLAATPLAAQTVRGKVLDAATGEGVAQAEVQALSEGHDLGRARTAADGSFEMRLRTAGTVRIQARRTGYAVTLTGDLPVEMRETVEVEVRMSAAAVAMEPLRVTARVEPPRRRSLEVNGFYERERKGTGKFLRREDLASSHTNRSNQTLGQVLSRVPGALISYQGPNQYVYFQRNGTPVVRRTSTAQGTNARWGAPNNACLPRVFLDGARVIYDAQTDINGIVDMDQVEAVEVFRSASEIPVQYNDNNSQCGVIVIWTRKEP
jgi:hypothetical protein